MLAWNLTEEGQQTFRLEHRRRRWPPTFAAKGKLTEGMPLVRDLGASQSHELCTSIPAVAMYTALDSRQDTPQAASVTA